MSQSFCQLELSHTKIQFISQVVKLFQQIGVLIPRFSLSHNWSNYSNKLELSYRDSVYLRSLIDIIDRQIDKSKSS